jgi:hypothetical protein
MPDHNFLSNLMQIGNVMQNLTLKSQYLCFSMLNPTRLHKPQHFLAGTHTKLLHRTNLSDGSNNTHFPKLDIFIRFLLLSPTSNKFLETSTSLSQNSMKIFQNSNLPRKKQKTTKHQRWSFH